MVTFAAIKKAQSGQSDAQRRSTAARTTFSSSGKQVSGPTYDTAGNQTGDLGTPDYLKPTPTTEPIAQPTPELSPALQPPTPTMGEITPKDALANAQASGVPAPQDAGEAKSQMQQFAPTQFYKPSPTSDQVYAYQNGQRKALSYDDYIKMGGLPDFSNVQAGVPNDAITQQVEADPGYQQWLQASKEAMDVMAQRTSLTEEYTKLTQKLGIDAINTELMNMKNIIEGTEDDIRTEVTKAGGFATESQVQALTLARNKQLVKNYNNLLETKQMAMETVNTMIGLAAQDRQFAQQAALQKLNIETQLIEYRNRMAENSKSQYEKILATVGYGGLMQMTGGDPWYTGLVEKNLGLQPGQLSQLASIPGQRDTQVVTAGGRSLLIDTQTGDTIKDLGGAYKTSSSSGRTPSTKVTETESSPLAEQYLSQNAGPDGRVSPEAWRAALNAWLDDGHTTASFLDRFGNYVNKTYDGWKNNYVGF